MDLGRRRRIVVRAADPRPIEDGGRMRAGRRGVVYAIAAIFVLAGVLHFAIPRSYESIVPPFLPARLFLVYLSGACELVGGLGLLPRSQATLRYTRKSRAGR